MSLNWEGNDLVPADKSVGWKPWDYIPGTTQERWWTGTQWTETYRFINDEKEES
jgi:hypothetical protein